MPPCLPRLSSKTKHMPCQAAHIGWDIWYIKGLRALAAGRRGMPSVPHKVTGLAGEHRKCSAIKRIAGATLPSGCYQYGSPDTTETATGQETSRAPCAA
jgi:hypothetical protein